MDKDITAFLKDWEYDPAHTIRIITAEDGRQVMQVRLALGIEQYELSGRPDGKKTRGFSSWVEYYEDQISRHIEAIDSDEGFSLSPEDCSALRDEGFLVYNRYVLLFQINDFDRVIRDTEHNLRLCALLEEYCENTDDATPILQYKPYILRMHATAQAMSAVFSGNSDAAEVVLTGAIEEIESMSEIDTPAFQFEKVRSLNYLKATRKQVEANKPTSVQSLEEELSRAVEEENYEKAALIRDRIREISARSNG
jgi:hypothetical protein